MKIRPGNSGDVPAILTVWRAAVEATHDFLSPSDIERLEPQVRDIYLPNVEVYLCCDAEGVPFGFIGLSGNQVEMLFIDPVRRGQGAGKALIGHARKLKGPLTVDVNEQNPQAHGFYLKCGFRDIGRSELDGQGLPFPLIHMAEG